MRGSLVETFYETLDYCFDTVVGEMLGTVVRDSVYSLLERNGIQRREFATRFDNVVEVLTKTLGTCSRVIVHRTVTEMYKQYSQRMDFNYEDSLRDHLMLLKEQAVTNHLMPRRRYETSSFDSLYQQIRNDGSTDTRIDTGDNSLFPFKRGVKS